MSSKVQSYADELLFSIGQDKEEAEPPGLIDPKCKLQTWITKRNIFPLRDRSVV